MPIDAPAAAPCIAQSPASPGTSPVPRQDRIGKNGDWEEVVVGTGGRTIVAEGGFGRSASRGRFRPEAGIAGVGRNEGRRPGEWDGIDER
jgi:hypothetical protein